MKTPRLRNSARTAGFTLIELLVVISIIAILAGFALPVFTAAQKKGRITDSLSNCKQIGLALRMYSGDNDGIFPAIDSTTASQATPTALQAGDPSNKAFENLMPKYSSSKKIFANKGSGWCKNAQADTTAADSVLLKQGQNDWLYMLGLSDTSDARWPLIATAPQDAGNLTYTSITTAKGGVWAGTDVVVGFCDGSARPIGGKDMNTTSPTAAFPKSPEDGVSNLLTATTTWLGTTTFALVPQ